MLTDMKRVAPTNKIEPGVNISISNTGVSSNPREAVAISNEMLYSRMVSAGRR